MFIKIDDTECHLCYFGSGCGYCPTEEVHLNTNQICSIHINKLGVCITMSSGKYHRIKDADINFLKKLGEKNEM